MANKQPVTQQWLINTNSLVATIDTSLPPKEQMKHFATCNQDTLALLPASERDAVLKYWFPADAAMSLVSQLLKHLMIAETCSVPFQKTIISRHSEHGKPCYTPPPTSTKSVAFNVSHQAGLVALIAIPQTGKEDEYDVGIDIVCVNERGDFEKIMTARDPISAFNEFVGMHEEVFSRREIAALKMEDEATGEDIRKGMRRFYALWCLREAYVKMTGEALLASWLGELEFREFPVPEEEDGDALGIAADGEFKICFKDEKVSGVKMKIVAKGQRYMVASAVRRKDGQSVDVAWTEMMEMSVADAVNRVKAAA